MNKDVIYLEPEDDITDILTKLQQAEHKVVALVPPKKATMLRSAVNMKLVARVAKECEKVAVVVTADPAIVKMALNARIPVAKNLNSRPIMPPKAPESAERSETAEPAHSPLDDLDSVEDAPEMPLGATESDSEEDLPENATTDIEIDEDGLETASPKPTEGKKAPKTPKSLDGANFFVKYRKWFAIGVPAASLLVLILVWAFVFAPAATITVAVGSTASNFSEAVSFTTDAEAKNPSEGRFFVAPFNLEQKYTTELAPTKEENHGTHAGGDVSVSFSFRIRDYLDGAWNTLGSGTVFTTASGAAYRTTKDVSWGWDGTFPAECSNGTFNSVNSTCVMSATVPVEAVEAGAEYDLVTGVEWNSYQGLGIANDPITGGTTELVKVISQEDVDKAVANKVEDMRSEGRKMLLEDLGGQSIAVDASLTATPADITVTPAVGQPLKDDEKAKIEFKVNYGVAAIPTEDVETFIKSKISLSEDQKLYSIGNPYFERFTSLEESARLKTVIEVGPIVSEDIIFEKAAGRKTGEISSILRSVNGINEVEIRTSFFWVWSIPTDRDKVTINIDMENK